MSREEKWKTAYKKIAEKLAKELLEHAKNYGKELKLIAELGYGRGKLTDEISKIIKKSKLIAIDIKIPEQKNKNERIFLMKGDARKLMLKQGTIDAFYSNFFVSWIKKDEIEKVFSEAYAATCKYGIFIVSDFIFNKAEREIAKKIAIEQGKPENNLMPTTWHSMDEISAAIKKAGFREIRCSSFSHDIKFSYDEAVKQLEKWHATKRFIESVKPLLKEHGMKLPDSYIISGIKS